MRTLHTIRHIAAFMGIVLTLSAPTLAQGIKAGSGEVAGTLGWESLKGIDDKTHIAFGVSGGFNATEKVQLFGEYTYLPMGSLTLYDVTGSQKVQLVGGGVRIHFRGASAKVNPFLVAAGGFNRTTATVDIISVSASGGYGGAGGGVTVFLGPNFGVRPEARFERLQWSAAKISGVTIAEGEGNSLITIGASFFFQFGGR